MNIIILIIIIVIGWWVISSMLKKAGLKRITEKVAETTSTLKRLIENKTAEDIETYSKWLKESNPEELWAKALAHSLGKQNKKELAELGAKIYGACEAIQGVLKTDHQFRILVNAGAMDMNLIEELKRDRQNLITVVEQSFTEIKKIINS